jgi:hypothetical protein
MTSNVYTSPFTGDMVQPTDVSYQALALTANTQMAWPSYVPANSGYIPLSRIVNVTPNAAGYIINLPPANQGTVGSDVLIRNLGNTGQIFYVNNFDNTSSVVVNPGQAVYFYLSDNTTEGGTWSNFVYGTGASSADASSLAGPGLANILGKLVTADNVTDIFAPPTLTEALRATTYNWTSGANTITLPTSASLNYGWYIMFRNSGTGVVNFATQGTSTINGVSSLPFEPNDSGIIVFNKSTGNFNTIGLAPADHATFSSATYDVDNIVGSTYSLASNAPTIQTYVALSGTRSTNLEIDLPAITQLYVLVNNTGHTNYSLTFKVAGSSQTPIAVGAGSTALVLSDSNILYVLSSSNSTIFQAVNGSASAPSFSFISDTNTGMYLAASNILGFSADGVNLLTIDNSNPLNPQVSTSATFNAGLISGGAF